AAPAAGSDILRALPHEVREDLSGPGGDDGAAGHGEDQVLALRAVALRTLTGLAVGGAAVRAVVVVDEGGDLRVDPQHDVPAAAAVAPVRAPERLELLAVDRGDAMAAVPGAQVQHDAVDEVGHGQI